MASKSSININWETIFNILREANTVAALNSFVNTVAYKGVDFPALAAELIAYMFPKGRASATEVKNVAKVILIGFERGNNPGKILNQDKTKGDVAEIRKLLQTMRIDISGTGVASGSGEPTQAVWSNIKITDVTTALPLMAFELASKRTASIYRTVSGAQINAIAGMTEPWPTDCIFGQFQLSIIAKDTTFTDEKLAFIRGICLFETIKGKFYSMKKGDPRTVTLKSQDIKDNLVYYVNAFRSEVLPEITRENSDTHQFDKLSDAWVAEMNDNPFVQDLTWTAFGVNVNV